LKEPGCGLEIVDLSILPLVGVVFFFSAGKWFALDKGKDFLGSRFFSVPETRPFLAFTSLRSVLAEDLSA